MWIFGLIIAAGGAGCGIQRYATYQVTSGGDLIFVEGPVTGRMDVSWYKGRTDFRLAFSGEPLPKVRDVAVQIDWVAGHGHASFPRQRCEAPGLSCEVPDPKHAPDDMTVEISFTLIDPGGSPRRIVRQRTLHRDWDSYFWILRDC